jgi:acyl CoA:acetate/3-ketoacid CoA transferase alpha subunit/acyl CoA:acetate/3-ketoacid CoA transferase beta subunit
VTSKVVNLHHAIENNIAPGMTVHISLQAGAATCELVRQFWGKSAEFTLIMNMIGGHHALSLVHGGLVKKLIFATCADIYPRPYPNPVIQRAFKSNSCELENWSMLSLTQALMAGALNLPFTPTRSVIGSSLADDNKHAFKVVEDVFGSGEKIGLIKSLCPDISIIHGWAADPMGNVILPGPPRDAWAAKASRNGIIVCVEKLVSEDFIRNHSLLVKIPGSLVNAVCVAPFGAHPQNMSAQSLPEFEGYGLDHAFLKAFRKATEDADAFDQWVKNWILECRSHEDYLDKLGKRHVRDLMSNGKPQSPEIKKKVPNAEHIDEKDPTPSEYAIIGGARIITDIILKHRYKTMFAGIGLSGLAGWCAYYLLKEEDYHVDLIAAGIGYQPCPGDPLLISAANMATAKMISDSLDLHGVSAGGINSRCLGVLGAGQIDKYGNINSTIIRSRKGDDIYLAGAGGGNDIASAAQEVVVVAVNRVNRFVENVRYVTCPGTRVSTLATNEGLYVKNDSEFILKAYYPKPDISEEKERINEIIRTCGWDLSTVPELEKLVPPTSKELGLLRSFDPDRVFLK